MNKKGETLLAKNILNKFIAIKAMFSFVCSSQSESNVVTLFKIFDNNISLQ